MRIKIPQSNYTNYYDAARFNLTWNLTLILSVFLSVLSTILVLIDRPAAIPTLAGLFISFSSLLILKTSGKYKLTAITYSISGLLLNQYTLLFFPEALHFADPIWMIITVLFTYFTLGKIWGNLCLTLSIVGSSIFILFFFNENLERMDIGKIENLIVLVINFSICSIIVAFLIFQFLKLTQYAEDKYVALTDTLKSKNYEKSVLLKEVHHRVKNNLQVIISLLRLQSAKEDNSGSFSDTVSRIRSMSLIHEKMYQTDDFANIDLEEYLQTLSNEIIDSSSIDCRIELFIESDINSIKMKSLVPVALIFHELLTNSIKHAFKGKEEGKITIDFTTNENQLTVIYSDNGKWLTPVKENSLGIELIDSLTDQLTGSFKIDKSNGTKYTFQFIFD
ncbi:MAG: sensor histidine kinase [Crocinitomicaceae bacterium]